MGIDPWRVPPILGLKLNSPSGDVIFLSFLTIILKNFKARKTKKMSFVVT
jgi:hypothetical protein